MKKLVFLIVISLILTTVPGFLETGSRVEAAPSFQRVSFANAVVTATKLNVRQGPATTYPVICTLDKGQEVKIFGKLDNWYAVYETATGSVGCVDSKFINVAENTTPEPTTPNTTTPSTQGTPDQPSATTGTPNEEPPSGVSTEEQQLLELVNKARTEAGVGALAFDTELQKVARMKAEDMVNNNYFSHQSPTYGSPFDMMRQFGVEFKTAGENIAGNQTIEKAFNAWMNSEGHRRNKLNGNFNQTGIAIVDSPTYGKVFVQMFVGK